MNLPRDHCVIAFASLSLSHLFFSCSSLQKSLLFIFISTLLIFLVCALLGSEMTNDLDFGAGAGTGTGTGTHPMAASEMGDVFVGVGTGDFAVDDGFVNVFVGMSIAISQ
jgi:hypothetical protein